MDQVDIRCFAIVPAAGASRRMGQPKLLLPWPDGPNVKTVIDKVLSAWTSSRVSEVLIVVRGDDEALKSVCASWPVAILQAEAPPDMKASIQTGLRHLESKRSANKQDRCFIAPADLPGLSPQVIDQLIDVATSDEKIVVPEFGGVLGHPALIPWSLTPKIFELGEDEGVNRLIASHPTTKVPFPASMAFSDIDTPEEYRQALRSSETGQRSD